MRLLSYSSAPRFNVSEPCMSARLQVYASDINPKTAHISNSWPQTGDVNTVQFIDISEAILTDMEIIMIKVVSQGYGEWPYA